MSSKKSEDHALPTKDVFERYWTLRDSAKWAAFYLIATSGLLLAWSRSPTWTFKIPFDLFVVGREPQTVPSGFAPIFGPLVEMFLYYNLYVLVSDCLLLGEQISRRLGDSDPKRLLLRPPFEFGPIWKAETLVNWFWLSGVFVISVLLLTDFFNLTYEGDKTVWRLLLPLHLGGVTPRHSGHDVGATVFGLWQPWLYVVFLAYKASVLYRVARNTHRYQTMLANKHAARSLAPPQQPAGQSSETASPPGREDMKAGKREGDAKGGRQERGGEET